MKSHYEEMDKDTLKKELRLAKDRLEDIESTFNFTLANTNTHLADSMVLEFEQELYEHRALVRKLELLLA